MIVFPPTSTHLKVKHDPATGSQPDINLSFFLTVEVATPVYPHHVLA